MYGQRLRRGQQARSAVIVDRFLLLARCKKYYPMIRTGVTTYEGDASAALSKKTELEKH